MTHRIWIGTSGWSYKHWRGTFYPEGTPTDAEFAYYLSHFDSVEINNTFYRLPQTPVFTHWKNAVPDDFVYAVKASRYTTHMKRLKDPVQNAGLFLERSAALGEKLGVILFQLPPQMQPDLTRLRSFLEALPRGQRYAFEFRDARWYSGETYDLLRDFNCAFCIYELAGYLSPMELTADFVYVRLHGPGDKYQGSYSDVQLQQWADQCKTCSKSRDVFVYFDNDEKGYAAFNALTLRKMLGQ